MLRYVRHTSGHHDLSGHDLHLTVVQHSSKQCQIVVMLVVLYHHKPVGTTRKKCRMYALTVWSVCAVLTNRTLFSQKNKDKSNEVTWGFLNIISGWCSIWFTTTFSTPAIYSYFFHSCIFLPLLSTPAFSTPAFSTLAILPVSHFPLPNFQSPRMKHAAFQQLPKQFIPLKWLQWTIIRTWPITALISAVFPQLKRPAIPTSLP